MWLKKIVALLFTALYDHVSDKMCNVAYQGSFFGFVWK